MRTTRRFSVRLSSAPAALVVLALASPPCLAQDLMIRNESNGPLLINVVGVVGKALRRERPVLLNPKDVSPAIAIPGNKVLTIYDGKAPNRVLFQGVVPASPMDQFIAVLPGFPPPRMRIEARQSFRGH